LFRFDKLIIIRRPQQYLRVGNGIGRATAYRDIDELITLGFGKQSSDAVEYSVQSQNATLGVALILPEALSSTFNKEFLSEILDKIIVDDKFVKAVEGLSDQIKTGFGEAVSKKFGISYDANTPVAEGSQGLSRSVNERTPQSLERGGPIEVGGACVSFCKNDFKKSLVLNFAVPYPFRPALESSFAGATFREITSRSAFQDVAQSLSEHVGKAIEAGMKEKLGFTQTPASPSVPSQG